MAIQKTSADAPRSGTLLHALYLLAAADLGREPEWPGVQEPQGLRARVETLAALFDMVPRGEAGYLGAVVEEWADRYPARTPVPPSELRRVAREVLARAAPHVPGDESFRRAAAFTQRGRGPAGHAPPLRPPPGPTGVSDAEAERQCAFGLMTWFHHLGHKARWTHLPGAVPGEAPSRIDLVVHLSRPWP